MKMLKLLVWLILLITGFVGNFSPAIAEKADYQEIDQYIKEQMKEQSIVGLSYVIVKEDKIVQSNAFGNANLKNKLTPKTPMRIGSLSKSFTALAIMQLVEKSEIDLQAPVTTYIPWFQLKNNKESSKITIIQLLNQISGIPGDADMKLGNDLKGKSIEETVKLLNNVDLSHPIGMEFEYSNFNYVTLGLIVEKVSGETLGQYIDQHILKPLKMENSYTSVKEAEKHGLSKGFSSWFGGHYPAKTFMDDLPNFLASGYMVTSAEDLGKYMIAFMNGSTILSAEGFKQLQTPSATSKMMMNGEYYGNYAMGWFSRDVQGIDVIGHAGDLPSVAQSDMYILPETKEAIVILSNTNNNYAPGSSHMITDGVVSLLAGKEPIRKNNQKAFQHFYMIVDGVIIVLILLMVLSSLHLKNWKLKLIKSNSFVRMMKIGVMILQLVLPAIFSMAVPKWLHLPKWGIISAVQPDIIITIEVVLFMIFLMGVGKLFLLKWQSIKKIKQLKEMDTGR
ncbi:MAG TPA: serine hydrolase domain-containing protein [Pseudoneobacillus sp.]|nr:serine hydrolase domain-containing protein [Pseudoneobacillus sp.]